MGDQHRDAVRRTVGAIEPWDGVEAIHQLEVLSWIDSGAPLCRTVKPATPPQHLVSYAVLVDSQAEALLLVDHVSAGRWLPTGGHVEPDELPADAAMRELDEELGVEPRFFPAFDRTPALITKTTTGGQTPGHIDVSLWFAFDGHTTMALTPDKNEFTDVRWWTFAEVLQGTGAPLDPHVARFVAKLAHSLGNICQP